MISAYWHWNCFLIIIFIYFIKKNILLCQSYDFHSADENHQSCTAARPQNLHNNKALMKPSCKFLSAILEA